MATSEYCSCPPRLPTPTASHVAIASGVNHRVTSPRWTSARSYAGQFPTRYFVLYLGCTLDFTSRSCPFGRHDGQGRDEHLFPRTNAPPHSLSRLLCDSSVRDFVLWNQTDARRSSGKRIGSQMGPTWVIPKA